MTEPIIPTPHYIWFDTEFTSLKLEEARLLQVSLMITDRDLNRVVDAGKDLNVFVALAPQQKISPWVEENIPKVVAACREQGAVPLESLDVLLCRYLEEHLGPVPEEILARPVLAGNSLQADWFLARRFMPRFLDRLNYRMLDVTALKLVWQDHLAGAPFDKEDPAAIRRFFPAASLPDHGPHDAHYDVQASAAEFAYYRGQLSLDAS